MEPKKEEATFRDEVFRELKSREAKLEEFTNIVEIGKLTKILKGVTVAKVEGKFKIILGFAEQDIVVHLKKQIPRIANEYVLNYRLGKKQEIAIPLVILETKTGKELVTHALITYSHIAMEIKDKFPFVMYNVVIERTTKKEETFWRQGKFFDKIFIKEKQPKMHDEIFELVKDHLVHLRNIGLI